MMGLQQTRHAKARTVAVAAASLTGQSVEALSTPDSGSKASLVPWPTVAAIA